jgi:spermidine synthase
MAGISDNATSASARGRFSLGLLALAWGVQAIITQSLLVREAIVLMSGSEFAWGVVLFAWLLGVAVGAPVGSWLARRRIRPEVALALVLFGLGVATAADLWILRGARAWLGVQPGEMLPLAKTALASLLFIPPTSLFIGTAFPLACAAGRCKPLLSFARVYAIESAGSLIGGAVFSFWLVDQSSPIQTVLVCTAMTTAAAAGSLRIRPGIGERRSVPPAEGDSRENECEKGLARAWWAACFAVIAAASLLIALSAGSRLDRWLIERRWETIAPGYELVAEGESRYQNLALGVREHQYSLYCNGQIAADFPDPYAFVPLAHLWMCEHPAPRRVLVLGGGAEGLLAEILRHPVESVDYVEPDAMQIELILPFLAGDDRRALHDARVTVHHEDARHFVKRQLDRFDLVIARLPEPTSAFRARFYTAEFFGELRRAMTPRSVMCMTATAAPGELSPLSAEYLASIRATIRRHFPSVTICWGDPAHIFAATQDGLTSVAPAELARRYTERGVQPGRFNPLWFEATDRLAPEKVRRRACELDEASGGTISADLRPTIYLQRLALWERMTGGPSRRFIEQLRSVKLGELIAGLAVLVVATLLVCRAWRSSSLQPRGSGRGGESQSTGSVSRGADPSRERGPIRGLGAIVLSVATTGFVTMAVSIVWLFAFQNLYGHVYQRIGWIVALFMAGLVIGCLLSERWARRDQGGGRSRPALCRRLIVVDVAIALLAAAIPQVLAALGRLQTASCAFSLVEWTISILMCLTGVVCGAAFPLAGAWLVGGRGVVVGGRGGIAAGVVVGADHAGACVGALLTGILLVPVFGTTVAAYVLAGTKLVSAVVLATSSGGDSRIGES